MGVVKRAVQSFKSPTQVKRYDVLVDNEYRPPQRTTHVLVDTSYLLKLAQSEQSPQAWLNHLLKKGAVIHLPMEVLEEFQKYTKNPKLVRRVVEIINLLYEASAHYPTKVMIWEKEPSSSMAEARRKWGRRLAEVDKKGNSRISSADAQQLQLKEVLEKEGRVVLLTTDSDLHQLHLR
ncbi:MAG: hypothetical protein GXN92_00715 [Candidatus Micrarchaeota archaeon]|nr:hypothetical protein [Candidatus Micrarchaeota archaeon]